MKIDRLLSILIYLLNRNLVSARELSERFEVSLRTIQRDIDDLSFAGIPIHSVQGPQGGYGIVETFKLDRQLVDTHDLFFILTALESISTTFKNKDLGATLEKVRTLVRDYQAREIAQQKEKLCIDFGAFSTGKNGGELFSLLEEGIEFSRLIEFDYTTSSLTTCRRKIEPMTIIFKWYSWYLFGFCLLRNDYRLFRLSRMENVQLLKEHFDRREGRFADFEQDSFPDNAAVELILKFDPSLKVMVEDYFSGGKISRDADGNIIVRIRFPRDEWLYSMLLGYGDKVEVLEPLEVREKILEKCQAIAKKYQI